MQNFTLLPFEKGNNINNSDIDVKATISLNANQLTIDYELIGSSNVIIPIRKTLSPMRLDKLWENTCFELFIAEQGKPHYWEFNLSPSGNWNVYRFKDYRQGMVVESAIQSLPFVETQTVKETLTLTVTIDLDTIMPKSSQHQLDIAITSVIRNIDNELSYWALNHCGEEPDFHDRRIFVTI